MEKNLEDIQAVDFEMFNTHFDSLVLERTPFLAVFVENYREKLIKHYKGFMQEAFDESTNLDLMDEFIREAAYIMQASNDEILNMFFEDAQNKYADMEDEEYFNQLFETATQFP
ncbi:hypothetical protein NXZ75_01060 [Lysinibacillus sphaericus]|uniref:hypothetical protein n=1 Tax=Lysinibacillus sphaericus TaxID=1421 RepID=UPI00216166E7|nr:hypothetical protein [Lysinibacillus sphaericus]MCS1380766.1 hypothetical protein [Lysinibacillus sphaericus]